MDETFLEILILFLLLVANGVFAMSEIALVSSRKVRLQQMAKEGDTGAKTALDISETPTRFLSTVQIGITLIGIMTGAIGGATLADKLAVVLEQIDWLQPYSGPVSFAIVVLLTTYFTLVIGELIPKRLGMNNPEQVARSVALPMKGLSWITAPVVNLLSASTELGLKILGVSNSTEPSVTEEEIRIMMKQGAASGIFEEAEEDMVSGIFKLGDRYIDSIMTPRTELEWIDLDETYEEILSKVHDSKHTRFPVATNELDQVHGILSTTDLLSAFIEGEQPDIKSLVQPPLFVPDSTTALNALDLLKEAGAHAALVIDEFSGVLGMVTLYDVLKAIVGIIPTAGEEPELEAIQREDGSWLLDGLIAVDELKDILGIEEFPEEHRVGFQTLGGFMMTMLDHIPEAGEYIEALSYRFEIMDMDGRRVDKVLVIPIHKDIESNSKTEEEA